MKAKVPNPTYIEHALELVGFKIAGHPTVVWPFVVIECFLDPALSQSPSGNLEERAAPSVDRWRAHGVSWHQAGNRVLVFIRQKRRTGKPAGPDRATEAQAAKEFELRKAGLGYQAIRDKLYPQTAVETEAIKQRVSRYAKRPGQSLK